MNLRELAVSDLKRENIRDWGLPVQLIDPDGTRYTTDNETGETLKAVQILYDYRKLDPGTGEEVTVHEPIVVMMKSSLSRIPVSGENWVIKMPIEPNESATLETRVLSKARAIEGGSSLGYIRLYPGKVIQS